MTPQSLLLTRRQALKTTACGFGYLALAGLTSSAAAANPLAPRAMHLPPRAKRVIFLFMQGGPSHVDTFDYKPRLATRRRQDACRSTTPARWPRRTRSSSHRVMKSLWKFRQHGQIRPLGVRAVPAHRPARRRPVLPQGHAHRGHRPRPGHAVSAHRRDQPRAARRSARGCCTAWAPRTRTCPASSRSARRWATAARATGATPFCRRSTRAPPIGRAGIPASEAQIRNLGNDRLSPAEQRRQLDLLQALNAEQLRRSPGDAELEAVIDSFELAFRMQTNAPGILDLSRRDAGDAAAVRHRREGRPTISAGNV